MYIYIYTHHIYIYIIMYIYIWYMCQIKSLGTCKRCDGWLFKWPSHHPKTEVLTERFGFIVSCFRTPWFGSLEMAQNSIDILYINGEDDKDQPLIFFVFPPNFQPMSGALGSTPGLSWRRLLALARPGLYCSVWAGTPVKVGGFTNKQWGIYLTWLNSTKKWWSNGDIIWYDGIYIYIYNIIQPTWYDFGFVW